MNNIQGGDMWTADDSIDVETKWKRRAVRILPSDLILLQINVWRKGSFNHSRGILREGMGKNYSHTGQHKEEVRINEMCINSNETGAIRFLINNWTTNQHYPLQSSSLGKPYTTGGVAPPPCSSAGSLHVEVPSAALSRPFGCCPQLQNDALWGGIGVSGKGWSNTDSDQATMGTAEPLEYPFWSKLPSRRWQCDRGRCRDAASKCLQSLPGHDEPFFWIVQGAHDSTVG